MIIKNVSCRKIDLPLRKPFVFSLGEINELNYGLVEISAETSSGFFISSLGEFACPWPVTGETQAGFIEVVEKFLGPLCLNRKIESAEDINKLNVEFNKSIPLNPSSKAAVEMALLDLLAREKQIPVHELLGNKKKDFVNITYVLTMDDDADRCVQEAKKALEKGFNYFKLKVGLNDGPDLEKIKRLSELFKEGTVFSVDVNEAWETYEKSMQMINKIKDCNVSWIEDPVIDIDELAKIRKDSPVKIMADASLWGPEDAEKLVKKKACDMFNIKLHFAGGILRSKQILDIAEENGIECIMGSCIETGIGTSASIQIACLSYSILTAELVGIYEITDKISSGIFYEKGKIQVPQGNGLGLEFNKQIKGQ